MGGLIGSNQGGGMAPVAGMKGGVAGMQGGVVEDLSVFAAPGASAYLPSPATIRAAWDLDPSAIPWGGGGTVPGGTRGGAGGAGNNAHQHYTEPSIAGGPDAPPQYDGEEHGGGQFTEGEHTYTSVLSICVCTVQLLHE
jgi:hypothetical protein